MLHVTDDRSTLKKRVTVCSASGELNQLLEKLLALWGFTICGLNDPSALFLVEDGVVEPCLGQKFVRLSSLRSSEHGQLGLPISIEALWQVLEQHFHFPPRKHMRRAVDLPARVLLRGEWYDTRLSSLSDMGTRFSHDRELVRQEEVIIKLMVSGELLQFSGQIIFSMAADATETSAFHSGVVFKNEGHALRDDLRYFLITMFLEDVRAAMKREDFQAGLAFLDLAPGVRWAFMGTD